MEIKFTRPQDAVAYAQDKGLTIFPICPSGSTKAGKMIDKTPAIPKWIEWAESTPRPKVLNYAKTNKMANFGVHCGLSGIVIVDVDVKEGQEGLATLAALEEKYSMCFGDTFTVRTPSGGFHYYFRNTSTRKITGGTCKLGPGIDVQAGNKYAVMFGSEIEDGPKQIGGKYTIINDAPMAALPDWIRDEIVTKVTKDVNTEGKIETPELDLDQPENIARAVEFLKTTDQICVEGSEMGGEYLYQIFLQVRDMGISEAFTRELVSQHYNERCEPPWDLSFGSSDLDHFSAKLANAYKYAQHSNPGAKTHEAKQIEHQEAFGVDPSLVILDKIVEPPNTLETMQGDVKLSSEPKLEDEYQGEAPVREWLVHEWIPLNEISSLYGAGGAGKSLLALQLGKAIANGIPFMNMEIPTPVPVLYVACEDNQEELHRRIHAIKTSPEYQFNGEDPPLYLWPDLRQQSLS